jgi:hypothetical protein
VIGGLHFINPGKNAVVANDVMGNAAAILDGAVIAYVTGDNRAVADSRGDAEVVVLDEYAAQGSQPNPPVKSGTEDKLRIKWVGNKEIFPPGTAVSVAGEYLNFSGQKASPFFMFCPLGIPQPVFVFSQWQKLRGDKIITVAVNG